MLAFLVNMAQLFEVFIAEWLTRNLPDGYELKRQERLLIESEGNRFLKIDLVIYSVEENSVFCVLDTKYKKQVDDSDLAQITTYAVAKGVKKAFLIYPQELNRNTIYKIGDIHIRTLIFGLDGNLQENGKEFLTHLLKN